MLAACMLSCYAPSVKLRPGECGYVGLFSLGDLQQCQKILSEHMAHAAGPRSESGHTWSAVAAWKWCQPRGGMRPRLSRASVDKGLAPRPWAPFSTSITPFKTSFRVRLVINQDGVEEPLEAGGTAANPRPRESKGALNGHGVLPKTIYGI